MFIEIYICNIKKEFNFQDKVKNIMCFQLLKFYVVLSFNFALLLSTLTNNCIEN